MRNTFLALYVFGLMVICVSPCVGFAIGSVQVAALGVGSGVGLILLLCFLANFTKLFNGDEDDVQQPLNTQPPPKGTAAPWGKKTILRIHRDDEDQTSNSS